MQETTERTRKLYTGITDAIFTLDMTGHFTHVNKQAEVLLERTESELVGKNIQDEFPAAANAKFDAEIRRAVVENVVVEFEEYYPPFEEYSVYTPQTQWVSQPAVSLLGGGYPSGTVLGGETVTVVSEGES